MLKVFMWIGWGTLLGAAVLLTLFVSAFGDEPRTRRAVQRAISPGMVWLAAVVLLGISLINRGQWWTVALAFLLALSPPVVLMALISLSMWWGRRRS